jgi:hypothetical protein
MRSRVSLEKAIVMRAFSLRVGEIISLPEQQLSIEVLEVQADRIRLGISGPFWPESPDRDLNYQEQIVFLESAG